MRSKAQTPFETLSLIPLTNFEALGRFPLSGALNPVYLFRRRKQP